MKQFRIAGALGIAAALAVPAVASGHGSVFEFTAKTVPDPANPPATQAGLADQLQYVVTNHGFTFVLRESNGQAGTRGMVNYKLVPGAYRNQAGFEPGPAGTRTRLLAEGDTGVQPHATCLGAAAIDSEADVLAWQGSDPFYNYVPFQAAPAGLEDEPDAWLDVIEAETDVDRSQLTNATDAAAACTSIGGTYRAADATVTAASSLASGQTAPLTAQVAELQQARAAADAAKAGAERARATALTQLAAANAALTGSRREAERYLLAAAPVAVDAFSNVKAATVARRGATVTVTGPALRAATVQLTISRKKARSMKLKSRVLARKVTTIGAGGSTVVVIKPGAKVAKALRRLKGSLEVSVAASSTSRDTASMTVSR